MAAIGSVSVLTAGLVINLPPIRSLLKTPALRVVGAGLVAGTVAVVGALIAGIHGN